MSGFVVAQVGGREHMLTRVLEELVHSRRTQHCCLHPREFGGKPADHWRGVGGSQSHPMRLHSIALRVWHLSCWPSLHTIQC